MNISMIDVVLVSVKLSSFLFILFFFFLFGGSDFHYSVFQLTDLFCLI